MLSRSFGVRVPRLSGRLAIVLLLLARSALAAPPALTLEEATRLATERAPMLEARRAGIGAAQAEAARAGALPDPMLVVGIDNLPVTGPDAGDFGADDMTMKRVGLRQDIPSRAKREARRTLATRSVEEAKALSTAEWLSVQRATALAWIDLWATQRELAGLHMLRDQAALAARLAKARVTGGGESPSDALATEAAVLELDNRIEAAVATHSAAQAGLARWIGDAVVGTTSATPDFGALPVSEAQLLTNADRLGPLLPAGAQLESAAAAIDVARAEKRPDWSVAASYGQRAGDRSDMLMVEVGIGLPLFARNRQDRGVAAREADYRAALATREDLRRQEIAKIRADIARWNGLKRQVALHESALLPLARDRSQTALAAYRAGGDVQSWLSAERDELNAHLSHAEHLGELGRAWAALAYLLPSEIQP
jgi:outer membrane protein TolC